MSGTSFGQWLTRRRKALDITRDELAQQANVSVAMLRKIENGERRPSKALADAIAGAVSIPISHRESFVRFARAELNSFSADDAPTAAPSTTAPKFALAANHTLQPNNLQPALVRVIGRENELAKLHERIIRDEVRLVTLVGPPGIGKTSLATEFARRALNDFADGVFFVPLASISKAELVPSAILQATGISNVPNQPALQTLKYALRDKHMLLVLDNFEHLLPAATMLHPLLSECVYISLLITSREPLRLRGERQIAIGALRDDYAVDLFVERAQAVDANFALDDDNTADVRDLCNTLGGMPLAIELAASWVAALTCNEISREIKRNFDFLATTMRDVPERHHSLRAAFDHSWKLLTSDEQRVLSALSVFRGGFDLPAMERVTGASLFVLAGLVSKSLVLRNDGSRFSLHELIRQYAYEHLSLSGALHDACERHLHYYLEMAETAEPILRSPDQRVWLNRLEHDHDNLRAALDWSLKGNATSQESLRLSGSLYLFWRRRAHWSEGRIWLKQALEQSADTPITAARLKAINAAVLLASEQADTKPAALLAQEGLRDSREFGEAHCVARALNAFGFVLWKKKDLAGARAACEEALGMFRALGDHLMAADTLHNLGHISINQGDYSAAQAANAEAAAIFREHGDGIGLEDVQGDLGLLAYLLGDYDRAQVLLEGSLARLREVSSVPGMVAALSRLGDLARTQGDYSLAERHYSEALALYRDMGDMDELPSMLHNQAYVALHRGDDGDALALFREGLAIQLETSNQGGIAECLAGLAAVLASQGHAAKAAHLFSAAEAIRETIGAALWPADRAEYEKTLAHLHQVLDEAAFATAWAEGAQAAAAGFQQVAASAMQIAAS